MSEFDPDKIHIDELVNDREKFNAFVYTPVDEAVKELKKRREDKLLEEKVNALLGGDIPAPFLDGLKATMFIQVTPNYGVRRFVSIVDALEDLEPLFFEYCDDKFLSDSEWKFHLGKLKFYNGRGKKGGVKIDRVKAVEFNEFNGERISDTKTIWGQSLIDFHHELFENTFRKLKKDWTYDASQWLKTHGPAPLEYYKHFLSLFILHGILFENYMLDEKELFFTKNIFLPAFIDIYKKIGFKPLIVALAPTEIEGEDFWVSHPGSSKKYIEDKLNHRI